MADENNVKINLEIDQDKFQKVLSQIEKNTNKTVDGLDKNFKKFNSGLSNFKFGVQAALGAFVTGAVVKGIQSFGSALSGSIDSAIEADKALRKLAVSLASTGEFSEENVKSFDDFADSIEKLTGVTAEAVLDAASLAKSFGLTNQQAKDLAAASVDLAAVTGQDVVSAADQLAKTYAGSAGALGKQLPILKTLTDEQLRNGEAIKIVANQYKGFAETTASGTFIGALTKAQNAFGDIFEELGKVITQNPAVIKTIDTLGSVFRELAQFVSENQTTLSKFVGDILGAIASLVAPIIRSLGGISQGFGLVLAGLQQFVKGFVVGFKAIGLLFEVTLIPLRTFIAAIGTVFGQTVKGIARLANAIPGVGTAAKSLGIDLKELENVSQSVSDGAIDQLTGSFSGLKRSFEDLSADTSLDTTLKSAAQSSFDFAENLDRLAVSTDIATQGIFDANEAAFSITTGIKNADKATKSFADTAKELENLKGSFDKVKSSVEGLTKENEKQSLSAKDFAEKEFQRAVALAKSAERELSLKKELTDENKKIIANFIEQASVQKKLIEQSKGLESVKGSYEKIKTAIEEINKANDKNQKTVVEQIKLEKQRSDELIANAETELALQNQLNDVNKDLLKQYKSLAEAKQAAALEEVSIGDFTPGELINSFSDGVSDIQKSFSEKGVLSTVGEGLSKAGTDFKKKLESTTVGDVGRGIVQAIKFGADILIGLLGGSFVQIGLDIAKSFLNIVGNLSNIFTQAAEEFATIVEGLPAAIDDLVTKLPELGAKIAKAIGDGIVIIAERLPEILDALINAIEPVILAIFQRAIPALIRALPGLVRTLTAALPGLISEILRSLPAIINELVIAVPQIVRALVDALPEIVAAFADQADEIVLALTQGLILGMGDVAIALVDSLIVKGGIFKIVGAIIAALPDVIIALVQGIARGLAELAGNIGNFIADGFKQGVSQVGNDIGRQFLQAIQGVFQQLSEAISKPFEPIIEFFKNLKIEVPGLSGGGGGGGGVGGFVNNAVETVGNVFKGRFAEGGQVPTGFPNDSFPARLTSGELVIPPGDTARLSNFLDAQDGGSPISNDVQTALLGQILAKLSEPVTASAQANVDGRAFADIILELSRNNARLSA